MLALVPSAAAVKLCVTKAISPTFRCSSERSKGRILLARSARAMECPRQRVGAASYSMLQIPSSAMSFESHSGQNSSGMPDDIQGM